MNDACARFQKVIFDCEDSAELFRNFSTSISIEGFASGLAVYLFEFEKIYYSPSLGFAQDDLEALDESSFSEVEEYFCGKSVDSRLLPGSEFTGLFNGSLVSKMNQFLIFPVVKNDILHAVFFLYEPQNNNSVLENILPLFFSSMEALLLREAPSQSSDSTIENESSDINLRRNAFAMDTIARASVDFNAVEGDNLFQSFLLNVIGVALCENVALFISQNQKNSDFMVKVYKGRDEKKVEKLALHDNITFIRLLKEQHTPVYFKELPEEEVSLRENILFGELEMELAIPMLHKQDLTGFLLLGKRIGGAPYSPQVLKSVQILLDQLSIAVETRKLTDIKYAFSRYIANQLIDEVLANPDNLRLGGTKKKVAILFADIRGFTSLSEQLAPEEVVSLLNTYMTALTEVIFKYEGTIDKYIGDCLMATFGAPLSRDNDPERAVMAAIDMQRSIESLNSVRRELGQQEVRIGIGLNSGYCVSGNMGSVQRMDYTVIGDIVNTAARLEQIAGPGQILITEDLFKEVCYFIAADKLDLVQLKGKKKKIQVYEVCELISDKVISYLESMLLKSSLHKKISEDGELVAKHLGLEGVMLKKFRAASLIYDIGMIRLPKHLWRNRGQMSEGEKRLVQRHPVFGSELLEKMRFFPEAISLARSHHENWDGSGYPDGLSGKDIPLFARIVSVVESYYAMTSEREYKDVLSDQEAFKELRSYADSFYDPEIVEAFLAIKEKGAK